MGGAMEEEHDWERDFSTWLARVIAGEVALSWKPRRKAVVRDAPMEKACADYDWRGVGYADTAKTLEGFKCRLRKALKSKGSSKCLRDVVEDILTWGGVYKDVVRNGVNYGGNRSWLAEVYANETLWDHINDAVAAANAQEFQPQAFKDAKLRSNAGLTKVYALATDHFIIYDSRVAAALGKLVVTFLSAIRYQGALPPDPLNFAAMAAQNDPGRRLAEWRGIAFGCTHNRSHVHMDWNVRANRVLSNALLAAQDNPGAAWCVGQPDALRRIEAALFMIGYDIRPMPPIANAQAAE